MTRRLSPLGLTRGQFFTPAWLRATALVATVACGLALGVPDAAVASTGASPGTPAVKMYGYAKGPGQRNGTAAGKAHHVPAHATRAHVRSGAIKGHRAPRPDLAPPPMGKRALVRTGSARRAAGHQFAGRQRSLSPSTVADNASYSVAGTFDTVPMADQNGRIAVTLTNTGTTTWGSGYGLAALVFPSSDTTGTGTPLSTGASVAISGSVSPGGKATVESVTPAENPGSYTICWDMVNAAGTYFSAEGGSEYCAPYTIQQYAPMINEQEPEPGTDVDSQTPTLAVSAVVPGGYPASPSFSYAFQILNGPGSGATVVASSGWVSGNGNSWAPTTNLTWGSTYYWEATVSDAASLPSLTGSGITWTTPISFVVGNAQPQVTSRLGDVYQADDGNPVMTSDLGGTDYSGSGKTVDPHTGNVSLQATDATVATAGPDLSVVRTYNSLDPRTSQAFGAGWSSRLDMSLVPDQDGSGALILTLADGEQVRFSKTASGGYASPQGMYAVVTPLSGDGFSVTDQTGTTYDFAQASGTSWLISGITDNTGMSETFRYSSGVLTTITNTTSGRSLHLTWSTPSGASYVHVATVATDPVTAGQPGTALTWTYGYKGDLLTSVCSPVSTTQCTTYSYITNGSHTPTSVLNADPSSYFRLDDASGATAAANEVPMDDLITMNPPATEMNTALGAAGPVSGTTATGFNGTTSWIPLDGMWCTTPSQESSCSQIADTGRVFNGGGTAESMAISVWFKTTASSGVLFGMSSSLPGANPCGQLCENTTQVPMLWIGSNGQLEGLGSLGKSIIGNDYYDTSAMSSSAAVNNGAWHQAVLIPGQALYLDGAKVATASASFTPPAGSYAMLGTGQIPSATAPGSKPPTWTYFNGSLSDVSIYQNQLPSVGTVAAQYAAETHQAAELASITSPAGRTQFSATYDTVNDRVATVTDAYGGTWTYGDPVNAASSQTYDSAVMGSAPEDFWPLNDTTGPLAQDLVDSGGTSANPRPPATYANVTLGAAGPAGDPDGTAASFSGSGSQVSIPGGYFAGTGAESVELWFKTTAGGTLLSASTPQSGGNPPALWIDSNGCLDAQVVGIKLGVTIPLPGSCVDGFGNNHVFPTVNNGKWHQAVLTLSPGVTSSPGTFSQTATLYQDSVAIASGQITTPVSPASAGYTAYIGNGANGDFTGSIADVSLYTTELPSNSVASHYSALQNQAALLDTFPSGVTAPNQNIQTITVTDPFGKNATYSYAGGALVRATSALGGVTTYGYDDADRASTITDPDGDTAYVTYDAHNNVTSTTTCAIVNNCQTSYASYYEDLANPLDPRNDQQTDSRDPRSSSPTDPTYDTVTTYTASGQIATRSTPATPACSSGCTTSYAYTSGSPPAIGGGTEPTGLLASITTPGGGVTSYAYDSSGDVMQVTDPLGLVTKYSYDNLGRQLTETQISNTYPAGLTTSYSYDGLDRLITETDPPVTNRVTGAVHTKVTTDTYDADSNVLTAAVSDATGGDPSRTTTYTYNAHDQLASATDPLGNTTSYTYDALGDETSMTNPAGLTTAYGYDVAGNLLTTTLEGYTGNPSAPIPAEDLVLQSRAYDPAGRLASVTNAVGTTTGYTYYGNNQLASSYIVSSGGGQQDVTSYSYDAAGNLTAQTNPNGLVTDTVYNPDSQPVSQTQDPSRVDRTITASYDPNGNITAESMTQAGQGGATQTATMTYNAMGQALSQTVDNTGGKLTTSVTRDQRGLVTSVTDPQGNTTYVQNDQAGRAVVETDPAVPVQTGNGGAPVSANPVTMVGYDTYGEQAESSDPDGNITTGTFNGDGQEISVTNPSYTPPGSSTPVNGTTTVSYNSLGQETSTTDPLGDITKYSYDQLGDLASKTDPDGGAWTYTYDPASQQLSVTDPTGAQTQATYNALGQMVTSTDLVRQNSSAAYTTSYTYNPAGDLTAQTSPTGVTTSATYDALGEQTSTTDGAGNTTDYAYNADGNVVKSTLPDGTAVTATYDQAGRVLSESDLSAAGTVLRTASLGYNADGEVTSATDFLGNTATATYDATGALTSQTEPVSAGRNITVSFGYDLDGNRTALTDGNGNTTDTMYNSLGLPQATTEPSTAAYNTAANSTTTDGYDAAGDLVTQTLPGGPQVNNTYNAMGDLTSQSGSGASAATATRTFSYDADGRMLTAATSAVGTQGSPGYQPATSESFGYDDRGLLLSATGSAGTSAFTYNGSGQLTSAADAAGTSSYTYDSAGRLLTDADAASAATGTYHYNNLDQVTQISYGTGNDTQNYGYDSLHRLVSDTVATASGAQVAAIGYGYDANNDVTSMTTSGLATTSGTGTVTNTYGYDESGRLTSWTSTPPGGSSTTQTYGYDNDGNLTNDNGTTQTYDARDELTASGSTSYSYAADGDLTSSSGTGGTTSYSSDAFGQQITDGTSSYSYDALDRLVSAASSKGSPSISLTYDGMTHEVASDSSATYSRDPSGQIVGVDTAAGSRTLALVDEHGDLSGVFGAAGATMTGSTTYGPWGSVLASTGPAIEVGYQGQWTDPATGQTDMGARFYQSSTGGFLDQDTDPAESGTAVTDNLHAYADDNPMSVADPSGHSPSGGSGSGGGVTQADVNAAEARAVEAERTAVEAEAAATNAKAAATRDWSVADAATDYANGLNSDANHLFTQATALAASAQKLYARAQSELNTADQDTALANELEAAAARMLAVAQRVLWFCPVCSLAADAIVLIDRAQSLEEADKAAAAMTAYENDMAGYEYQSEEASRDFQEYAALHAEAVMYRAEAEADTRAAEEEQNEARYLAAVAAEDEKLAAEAEAQYQQLLKAYQAEEQKAKQTKSSKKTTTSSGGCGSIVSCAEQAVTHAVSETTVTIIRDTGHSLTGCVLRVSLTDCGKVIVTGFFFLGTDGLVAGLADMADAEDFAALQKAIAEFVETTQQKVDLESDLMSAILDTMGELRQITTHTTVSIGGPPGWTGFDGPSVHDPVLCGIIAVGCILGGLWRYLVRNQP
jgi:RHS repeat-associated protein